MKNAVLILLLVFTNITCFGQDGLDESKKLGLISYLNTIKELSENKILWSETKFAQRNENPEKARKVDITTKRVIKEKYILLKWKTDLFINQFSADLIEKNSIRLYRKMNKYLESPIKNKTNKLEKYYALLKEIDDNYKDLFYEDYSTGMNFVTSATEILTLAGFNPYTLYKDIKATKEKKISTLIGYLKEMRLTSIPDLSKPKEKGKKGK